MSFFEELKRRNVFRVGVAYAVSAWVLLQVLDLVIDNTEAPDWVMDVFMIVVVLGFIVALVIAWAYELTPEGIKREADVDRSQSVTHATAKKLDKITLAALAVVVVLLITDRLVPESEERATATDAVQVEQVIEHAPELERGIAVLPFTNLSEDEGNAFFAGGVHEDILTHLSRIPDLRVISRTSMLRIAERGMEIPEIGQHLGVSHVLEGSVRRAGDQVRVTVQLIDAEKDVHLWAENYDRRLDDIFAIQSEIARQIAGQLQAEMSETVAERISEAPTTNLAAYDLYSRAREMRRVWREAQGFIDVLPLLEQAIQLDPDFLDAYVFLHRVYGRLYWTGADPEGIYRVKASETLSLIEQKWPDQPETAFARGDFHYTVERDYVSALEDYRQALQFLPNDTQLLMQIMGAYKRLARFEEGIEVALKAASVDPEHPSIAAELGFQIMGTADKEKALEYLQESVRRFPGNTNMIGTLGGFALAEFGDLQTFIETGDELKRINPPLGFENRVVMNNVSYVLDYMQHKVDKDNIDHWISLLDSTKSNANEYELATTDRIGALLLKLAGRDSESGERAGAALKTVQAAMAAGKPIPSNTPEVNYSEMAALACLAGDLAGFNQYRMIVNSLTPAELLTSVHSNYILGLAEAECGNLDTAWNLLMNTILPVYGYGQWSIALDPSVNRLFADYPPFQELVKQLEEGD